MENFARRFALLSGFVILLLLQMSPVLADTIYTAVLSGPTAGTASPAAGTATLTLNSAQTEVAYVVEYTGLQGPEIGAHIHNAPPGSEGPRLLLLFPGSPKVGTWAVSPFEVEELNAGRVYINVHTELFPTGEIRGDVMSSSVANEAVSWGAVKALYN